MKTEEILKTTKDIIELLGFQCLHVTGEHDHSIGLYICSVSVEDSSLFDTQTISSLHHIVSRLLFSYEEKNSFSFVVDINNVQRGQIDQLKLKADILAERAKSFSTPVAFDPMSSYERLLIHTYIASKPGFITESKGEGLNRHVVVSWTGSSDDIHISPTI
jgi:hypothetical protein